MGVAWRAEAQNDRRRITAWLAERNKPAALRVTRALLAAADSLTIRPEKGRPGRVLNTRELSSVPPYVIIYRLEAAAGVVRILRVWHTAQDRSGNA